MWPQSQLQFVGKKGRNFKPQKTIKGSWGATIAMGFMLDKLLACIFNKAGGANVAKLAWLETRLERSP